MVTIVLPGRDISLRTERTDQARRLADAIALSTDGRVRCARESDEAEPVDDLDKIVDLGFDSDGGCFVDGAGVVRCFRELPRTPIERVVTELRFGRVRSSWLLKCGITFERRVACWSHLKGTILPEIPTILPNTENAIDVSISLIDILVLRADGSVLSVSPEGENFVVAP